MQLNKLTLKDKRIFDEFLSLTEHKLSVYAFPNIYIWRWLFDISWTIIQDSLCIFFQDKIGCFLYLSPLTKSENPRVIKEVFRIMDRLNSNDEVSRIENVEEKDIAFYKDLGYECRYKSCDYICKHSDMVNLSGDKFKSKRSCFNYFVKHYDFQYLPFSLNYSDSCLSLYSLWMKQRESRIKDSLYQGMLKDSQHCLKVLLKDYYALDIVGRIVKINNELKAFSFGFKLNEDTFCILYEITDLSIKGLAQFIFREFCREMKSYKYINIMDDSGLENLKTVKLSYHPVKLVSSYIVTRKNAYKY